MEYKRIDGVELPVSRLIFGAAVPVMYEGGDASEVLDTAYATGITAYDTARGYGGSEKSLGDWMEKRSNRDKITLITKCCISADREHRITPEQIRLELSQSLEALRTDHIDIYFVHKDDKVSPVGPIVETLNELYSRGYVRVLGASNWTWERMEQAQEYAYKHGQKGFTVSQQCYSFLEQVEDPFNSVCLAGDRNRTEREWYMKNGMPVLAYSSLARGFLSGKVKSTDSAEKVRGMFYEGFVREYFHPQNMERLARLEEMAREKGMTVPQLALIWLLNSPLNVFPVLSPSAAHVADDVLSVGVKLTDEELQWLDGE
ncbi:MAG: aldo/keto reductase [Eubacteriales bacterium]